MSSTLPPETPTAGQARDTPETPLNCRLRIQIARSILNQRPPTPHTCDLAARALLGWDVVAEAGIL